MARPKVRLPILRIENAARKDIVSREEPAPFAPLENINLEFIFVLPRDDDRGSRGRSVAFYFFIFHNAAYYPTPPRITRISKENSEADHPDREHHGFSSGPSGDDSAPLDRELRSVIDRIMPLDQGREACEIMERREQFGKIVFIP